MKIPSVVLTTAALGISALVHNAQAGAEPARDPAVSLVARCTAGYHWDDATQSCAMNAGAGGSTVTTITTVTTVNVENPDRQNVQEDKKTLLQGSLQMNSTSSTGDSGGLRR